MTESEMIKFWREQMVQRRKELKLTRVAVARRMGTSEMHVYRLELGKINDPGLITRKRWAEALGWALDMVCTEMENAA